MARQARKLSGMGILQGSWCRHSPACKTDGCLFRSNTKTAANEKWSEEPWFKFLKLANSFFTTEDTEDTELLNHAIFHAKEETLCAQCSRCFKEHAKVEYFFSILKILLYSKHHPQTTDSQSESRRVDWGRMTRRINLGNNVWGLLLRFIGPELFYHAVEGGDNSL